MAKKKLSKKIESIIQSQKNVQKCKASRISKRLIHQHEPYWSCRQLIEAVRMKSVRKSLTEIHLLWILIISQQTRQSSALRAARNILLEKMSAATLPATGYVTRQTQNEQMRSSNDHLAKF